MILRIDDTDVERNTEASLNSIFDGLRWLDLGWDEEYRQSERLALHRAGGRSDLRKGPGLSRFHARPGRRKRKIRRPAAPGSSTPACAKCRARKATAAPPPASRSPCASACRATASKPGRLHRRRLRRAGQSHRRYRRFRPPAQRRHAHLSPGLLRRRCRPAHQPHHPRPGPPHQHLQARPDLRGRRRRAAAVRAPAAARRARRHQALQARHGPVVSVTTYRDAGFLPAGLRQFPVPARLVAQERSRADDAPGTGRALLVRRHQSQQRRGQFHRGRPVRSQGRLAQRRAHPHHAGRPNSRDDLLPVRRPASDLPKSWRKITPADPGAHQAAARRADRRRFLLRRRAAALRHRRADPAKRATPPWR